MQRFCVVTVTLFVVMLVNICQIIYHTTRKKGSLPSKTDNRSVYHRLASSHTAFCVPQHERRGPYFHEGVPILLGKW